MACPPNPSPFFKKVYEHILSKDQVYRHCHRLTEKPIAGNVFFHSGRRHLQNGASDKDYQQLRANNSSCGGLFSGFAKMDTPMSASDGRSRRTTVSASSKRLGTHETKFIITNTTFTE